MGSFNDFSLCQCLSRRQSSPVSASIPAKGRLSAAIPAAHPRSGQDATVLKIGLRPAGHTVIGGDPAEEQRREERPQKQDDTFLQGHMPLEKVHAGRSFPVKFS